MKKRIGIALVLALHWTSALAGPSTTGNLTTDDPPEVKEKPPAKNEISDILDSMGYPELQVVPRASERLAIEAKSEDSSFVLTHWPVEFSGLATLVVGYTARGNVRDNLSDKQKSDNNTIASITTTVGAAWLIGGVALGAQKPYRTGERAIGKYNGKDERSALMRERLAEEAMERPARVMRVLQNVAVLTNVAANGMAAVYANDSGKITAGVGLLMAFLPIMFEDHNIEVYDKQIEYKRKIYAPLKSASFHYDEHTKSVTPMTNLAWTF